MIRRPPGYTRTDTLFPYTTLCRSAEAKAAGALMAERGLDFDRCFTSYQTRAIKTLNLALEAMDRLWLPVEKHWRLNERHYGGLTGLNKAEMIAKAGEEQEIGRAHV